MKITGTITEIGSEIKIGDAFAKVPVVIQTDSEYPQQLPVDFCNKQKDLLVDFCVGDNVEVRINIRANTSTTNAGIVKRFPYLTGWAISKID